MLRRPSAKTVYERVKDCHDRPILNGKNNETHIAELMETRREKYEAAADIVVRTNEKSVLEICEELITKLTELEKKDV